MSISSQLPPIPLALASASLRALAQAAGQTVEAKVLSQSANGTTQVQIGRQVLNLTLPQSQPVGTTLTLSVQQADGQIRLTLEGVRPPGVQAPAPTAVPSPATATPATSVQLSAAALSGAPLVQSRAPAAGPVAAITPAPIPAASQPVSLPVSPSGSALTAPGAPYGGAPLSSAGQMAAPVSPAVPGAVPIPGSAPGPLPAAPVPVQPVASGATPAPVAPGQAQAVVLSASSVSASAPNAVQAGAGPQAGPTVSPNALPAGTVTPTVAAGAPAVAPPVQAAIPYVVAAPLPAAPIVAAGLASSAATALPPVGQAVPSSMVGQHAPAPNFGGASAAASAPVAQPMPGGAPPLATSPQVALAQMVQQAMPRQDSVVGLTTALTAAVGKFVLPEPVVKAAQQVLAMRMPLDGPRLDGAAIKAAVQKSGIFQEALLVSGQGGQAAGDAKSALLGLRQSLGSWLGQQAPVAQVAAVAPPLRGMQPRARAGDGTPPSLPDDLLEAGKILLERTEAALSRLRLHQNASLPDNNPVRQDAQWSLDLPVMVAGQQHLLNLQIHRDAEGDAENPEDRGWQIRFAINLSGVGEIGAQISMRSKTTGIMLWADQPETAAMLAAGIDELKDDLTGIGLVPGAVVIRTGAPMAPPKQPVGQAGMHVDARR